MTMVRRGVAAGLWLMVGLSGCGLFEVPAEYAGLECEAACGPCGLGSFDCETSSCALGDFEPFLAESDTCEALVFGREPVDEADQGGDGSREAPVDDLQEAIELAVQRGVGLVVFSGDSSGPIEVREAVHVLAGRAEEFRAVGTATKVLVNHGAAVEQGVCLNVEGIEAPTEVARLHCRSEGLAEVLVGARIVGSSGLRLRDVELSAGDGRDGVDGAPGADGEDGARGSLGGVNGGGGAGGVNAACPEANGGAGGRGAMGEPARGPSFGDDSEDGDTNGGAPGLEGAAGGEGASGTPGTLEPASFDAGTYRMPRPLAGGPGQPGAGGGGGGGGELSSVSSSADDVGGGGGGGGAGGCGGSGGAPGQNGGTSIGMIVDASSVGFQGLTVRAGDGGAGGLGGAGGAGGAGGVGGLGGEGSGVGSVGGRGGSGGLGGPGGAGADGVGGSSFAVYSCGVDLTMDGLTLEAGLAGAGSGGAGSSAEVQSCD